MNWLKDILGKGVSTIVDSVGDAIDKNVTSDEERLALKNELTKIRQHAIDSQEAEITARWNVDTTSSSWLTRNIRPMSLAWMIVAITLIAITDGAADWFEMKESYIDLFQILLNVMVIAYFGSRGYEKSKGVD